MRDTAAIILCAGKGSRMNDNSKSKVCFDCAGVPVIRRIIDNMKSAGVSRFVVVIGHQAYSVMDCLDGVDGVIYAYQKEQKVLLVCISCTVYDHVGYFSGYAHCRLRRIPSRRIHNQAVYELCRYVAHRARGLVRCLQLRYGILSDTRDA